MQAGKPNDYSLVTGWLARHLATSSPSRANAPLRALALGWGGTRLTLTGAPRTLPIPVPGSYNLVTPVGPQLDRMFAGAWAPARSAARDGIATVNLLRAIDFRGYRPANGATYSTTDFNQGMRSLAALIKADVGVEAAHLDIGGWDTHANQGSTSGQMHQLMTDSVRSSDARGSATIRRTAGAGTVLAAGAAAALSPCCSFSSSRSRGAENSIIAARPAPPPGSATSRMLAGPSRTVAGGHASFLKDSERSSTRQPVPSRTHATKYSASPGCLAALANRGMVSPAKSSSTRVPSKRVSDCSAAARAARASSNCAVMARRSTITSTTPPTASSAAMLSATSGCWSWHARFQHVPDLPPRVDEFGALGSARRGQLRPQRGHRGVDRI